MTVESALAAYLESVDTAAPGLIEGLYVVGSYALGDWIDGASDINIVAVTAEPATDDDFGLLRTAHALITERQATPFIDGPYLAWGDLVIEPATGLHRPWVVANELHHDGDCFEINPVLWYSLARYGIAARGPDPRTLEIPIDTEARIRWVVDNLQSYWVEVAQQVDETCADSDQATFDNAALMWCTLGSLRQHYTAFTGDITSERGAGEYGLEVTPPAMHSVIHAALARRAAGGGGEASADEMRQAIAVIRWCINEVDKASSRTS